MKGAYVQGILSQGKISGGDGLGQVFGVKMSKVCVVAQFGRLVFNVSAIDMIL